MLSRLASSVRIAPTMQRVVVPAAALRAFHSSRFAANAISIEDRKGPTGTVVATPGVIDHYGAIPFFGLLATALITKEVFIFDEGAILALNTTAVAITAYIGIGNSADTFFEGERTKDNNRFHDMFNACLETVHLYKSIESKKLQKVGVMKDLCQESREVNASFLKYLDIKQRHDARAAMVSKLTSIKKRESAEEAAEYQESITNAIEGVRASFVDPAGTALRAASLEFAIKNIGDVKEHGGDDPVREELYKLLDAETAGEATA